MSKSLWGNIEQSIWSMYVSRLCYLSSSGGTLQVFRFQSSLVTHVRSLATCGSSLRPKICRPAGYTEPFRRT